VDRLILEMATWRSLDRQFRAAAPLESGAFFLVRPGQIGASTRLLASTVFLSPDGGWEEASAHRLTPTGSWLSLVLGEALRLGTGIGFIHSHPDAAHPPELSALDLETSRGWAHSFSKSAPGPFVSLVWSSGHAAGVWFERGDPRPRELGAIQAAGDGGVRSLIANDELRAADIDDRQSRALTPQGNQTVRRLDIAVVGAGGTGSAVADMLARAGVRRVTVIDPDGLDTSSNLRRIVGSRIEHLAANTAKVQIAAEHVAQLGLNTNIRPLPVDVRSRRAAEALLESDLVINTTDTHSSRAFLNQVAYQYWVPVVDVGVRIGAARGGGVTGMPAEVRSLFADTGCLWCRGVLDSRRIREENLPAAERTSLAREGYVQGVGDPEPSLGALNAFAAAFAVITALKAVLEATVPSWAILDPWDIYGLVGKSIPDPNCVCAAWRGMGDAAPLGFLPG